MRIILILLSLVCFSQAQNMDRRQWVVTGRVSWFGGPDDHGVKPREGLALFDKSDLQNPLFKALFLPFQPKGTSGLARRLNPDVPYVACRWDYRHTPKEKLRRMVAIVSANGKSVRAKPADFGPAKWTRKKIDCSPKVLEVLGLDTGDEATVVLVDEEA